MKAEIRRPLRNLRAWLPGFLISFAALAFIIKLINWKEVVEAIQNFKIIHIIAVIILIIISMGFRTLAWQMLLGRRAKFEDTFWTINIGYMLNNLLPLRAGEIGRMLVMGRITGEGTFFVFSTIVVERAIDLMIAAGLFLSTFSLALGMEWARPVALFTAAGVVLGLFFLYFIARNHVRVQNWVNHIGERSNLVKRIILPRLDSLLSGLSVLTRTRDFLFSLFFLAICWLLYVLTWYILLLSLDPNAKFWWAIFTDSVAALGLAMPSAPGGLGVMEAATVGSLSLFGFSVSEAFAYSITMHFITYAVTIVLGLIGISKIGHSFLSLIQEIRLQRKNASKNESLEID